MTVKQAIKRPAFSKVAPTKGVPRKAAASRRRAKMASPYPVPPAELAGKWVAWSRRRIVANGDTLAQVMAKVEARGVRGASYERLPTMNRKRVH